MIDIFSPDYQLNRVIEIGKRGVEEAERATPEENMEWLRRHGIIDENGKVKPEFEFFKYFKRD